ncbi:uncharacterized protein [Haliotis asinina]|uniref:uncharacterized protein n=1 Tax=Haliotis asinina TaxID=109174 RepID=UPI00353198A6
MTSTGTVAKYTRVFVVIYLVFVAIASGRPTISWARSAKGYRSHRTGELPTPGCLIYTTVRKCHPSLLPQNSHTMCDILTRMCKATLPVTQYNCTSGALTCYLNAMKAHLHGTKKYTESPNGANQFLVDLGQSQNCTRTGTG